MDCIYTITDITNSQTTQQLQVYFINKYFIPNVNQSCFCSKLTQNLVSSTGTKSYRPLTLNYIGHLALPQMQELKMDVSRLEKENSN